MSLRKYIEKRKFDETAEPAGGAPGGGKTGRVFVIQKHAATRLHFDLRLEAEGVLKSWAVPKGMPRPGEKKLAVMVEDHPFEYRNFEGTIPPGNYGAGTVMIWDRGKYHMKNPQKDILESLENGEVTFALEGEKLRGEFTLVKLRKDEKNWLIIGKAGQKRGPLEENISVVSGKTMEELASGTSAADLGKIPGAKREDTPEFVEPMKAFLAGAPFSRKNWLFESKWDGYRVIAVKKGKQVNLYSRNRKNFNEVFSSVLESLQKIPGDFMLDGEVVVADADGKSDFEMLQHFLTERKGSLIYFVFDIPYLAGYNLENVKLRERKTILEKFLPKLGNVKLSGYVEDEGELLFAAAKKSSEEGIVAKDADSTYQEGKRSRDWLKIKSVQRQEAVIAGFTAPRGGRKKFGALVLGVYKEGKLVYIGHIGSGFTEKELDFLSAKLEPLTIQKSPFEAVPETNEPAVWVKPELVCEVKFSEWTEDGRMRQPIYLGLREDKNPEEVEREEPIAEPAEKKRFFSVPDEGERRVIGNRALKLTNLQKIFWPEEGYTKGDLIDYYLKIAKYILPHLKDRPQSLHRYPNGIREKSFYQKDMPDLPDWIQSVAVFSESEQKNLNFMLCQDEETLAWVANLGCIDLNPWNARVLDLEKPDYIVFDIDPPENMFQEAVRVAKATKKILDQLELVAFVKTSGKRGLHIYVPTGAKYSHEETREFARLVNLFVNHCLPTITSVERNPEEREGKVYLDFLQNRKGQTMAAPYAVRPRPGAPVSTPLEWDELTDKLDPLDFNMKNIFARLEKKGDLWEKMYSTSADLDRALKLLEGLMQEEKTKK